MYNDITFFKDKHFEKRGSIFTVFNSRDMPEGLNFVQDKISKSFQGVIRGFHGDDKTWKLISCLHGTVKLVTYNLDNDMKNEYILNGDSNKSMAVLVPPRVLNAHQCLSSNCIFYYKWSEFYTGPKNQWSVYYNDETIYPEWNTDYHQIVSERDINAQSLQELKQHVNS